MMSKKADPNNLTDEEVLREFVRRFKCDGAVLIYLDSDTEFGFGRWRNAKGHAWVNSVFKRIKQPVSLISSEQDWEAGTRVTFPAFKKAEDSSHTIAELFSNY